MYTFTEAAIKAAHSFLLEQTFRLESWLGCSLQLPVKSASPFCPVALLSLWCTSSSTQLVGQASQGRPLPEDTALPYF